jgi:hypothetical protein
MTLTPLASVVWGWTFVTLQDWLPISCWNCEDSASVVGVLGSYLACGMGTCCLKPGNENGSFQQVRLSTFAPFSVQPEVGRPNLQNVLNFLILYGGHGPKLFTWLYTIRRNILRLHTNLVPIAELYFCHSHFNTVVPSTRWPTVRYRINK